MKRNLRRLISQTENFVKVILSAVVLFAVFACSGEDEYYDASPRVLPAPTGVSASVSGPNVFVTWNAVEHATSYILYRSNSSSGTYAILGWLPTHIKETSAVDTKPNAGDNYYKIEAKGGGGYQGSEKSSYAYVYFPTTGDGNTGGNNDNTSGGNNSGNENSGSGNDNSGTGGNSGGNTQQKPSAPAGVSVANEGSVSVPYVVVRWNSVSGATKYYVYKSSSANGSYSKLGENTYNSYVDNNPPTNGKSAYYKVKAVNSAGESDYSSYAKYESESNDTAYAPAPVKYGSCTVSGTTMTLRWTIPSGEGIGKPTKAILRVRNPDSGVYVDLQTLSGTATSVSFTYTPWVDKDGYVYAGIITENDKGTSGGVPKVYDTKNKKWIN